MLPAHELATFLIATEDAVDLARDGDAAEGYEMLLAALHHARDMEGEPWGEELVIPYEGRL